MNPTTYKIALTLAVTLFIFSAGLFYVNKILLPIQIKGMAIKAAQDTLKRQVTFDTLQYSPLRGFVINGLVISQKDAPNQLFLRAKSVSAQVLFFALLQNKLIIPALRIDSPEISITRLKQDTWDFNDLLTPAQPATATSSKGPEIIISGFVINNGRVNIADISTGDVFNETVNLPLIKGSLSMNGAFQVNGNLALTSTNGTLKFDARIGLNDKSFKGNFIANNLALHHYVQFLPQPLPISLKRLTLMDANITVMTQKETTTITGDLSLPSMEIALSDGTQCQGDITMTKVFANLTTNNISVQGVFHGNKLEVLLPSGLRANLNVLNLSNLQATFKAGRLNITTDINAKELFMPLNSQQAIRGNLDVRNFSLTQNDKGYAITTTLDANDMSLTLNETQRINGRIILNNATASINGNAFQIKTDMDIKNAAFTMPQTSVSANITAPETYLSWHDGALESTLKASFNDLIIKAENISAAGSPQLTAHLNVDPQKTTPLTYTGKLEIPSLTVTGLPAVGTINNIHGNITFETNRAQTKNITFTAFDTPVNVTGELTHFEAPQITVTAQAKDINLSIIEKIIPAIMKEQGLTLEGTASGNVYFEGALAKPQEGKMNAVVDMANTRIQSKKLNQNISALSGHFEYNAPSLTWQDLALTYQGKVWNSHGSLQDFTAPAVIAFIKTENMSADIDARKKDDTMTINTLKGAWFDSTFTSKGTVTVTPGKDPSVDISNDVKLSLRDLPKMLPADQAKQIEALQLAGILRIKSHVKGVPQQWQDLASSTSIETPALYMMGYQVADLAINAQQKDGALDPLTITGTLYGGALKADATVDLKGKNFPFTLKTKLDSLDLDLLKKDTPLRQQQLAGMLNATADLKGVLLDIRHVTGQAAVNISKGYLWQLEILSKVLSIISSSFQGGGVVITDANASFKIEDQKIMTSDLTLKGTAVSLLGEGWVDFDQNIDLNITPKLETPTTGAVNPLDAINPVAGLVNIRVYGTITAPKFEHNLSAPQILKKTLQNTVGSIFKLFE